MFRSLVSVFIFFAVVDRYFEGIRVSDILFAMFIEFHYVILYLYALLSICLKTGSAVVLLSTSFIFMLIFDFDQRINSMFSRFILSPHLFRVTHEYHRFHSIRDKISWVKVFLTIVLSVSFFVVFHYHHVYRSECPCQKCIKM